MPTSSPSTSSTKFVRAKNAARWASVSKSTWHNWVRDGRVPPGIKLSPGVTVWNLDEVAVALGLEVRCDG
jgi:predicted DNA-binding transcriptional regulator AlpA